MTRHLFSLIILASCLLLDGCKRPVSEPILSGDAYKPIYASYSDIRKVETLDPQPIKKAGKIYIKDNYLLINDIGMGIHVVDNRNPENPIKLSFISIPGNQELAVKDSILYADNVLDMVALNIANPRNIRIAKRIENVFDYPAYPLQNGVRFECADPERGIVIGWEKATLENPQCYR